MDKLFGEGNREAVCVGTGEAPRLDWRELCLPILLHLQHLLNTCLGHCFGTLFSGIFDTFFGTLFLGHFFGTLFGDTFLHFFWDALPPNPTSPSKHSPDTKY